MEMAMAVREKKQQDEGHNQELKGTFASVMLLGLFIAATWLFVFVLYTMRS